MLLLYIYIAYYISKIKFICNKLVVISLLLKKSIVSQHLIDISGNSNGNGNE